MLGQKRTGAFYLIFEELFGKFTPSPTRTTTIVVCTLIYEVLAFIFGLGTRKESAVEQPAEIL